MELFPIDEADKDLINSAMNVIQKNYRKEKHTVGAAVRSSSGKIYVGVNIDSCGYGPCAEPIALGSAISNGERSFSVFVAIAANSNTILSPCGNCRQMLLDYSPDAMVIIENNNSVVKVKARDLLPNAYMNF